MGAAAKTEVAGADGVRPVRDQGEWWRGEPSPVFEETWEEHTRRCHPDAEQKARERQELLKLAQGKIAEWK